MHELLAEVPDVEVLLALEPEELAAKLLFLMRRRSEMNDTRFAFENERDGLWPQRAAHVYPRERQREIDLAFVEAWTWLEAQGLLVPDPSAGGGPWRTLSRRARRFEDSSEFTDYATARLLPRAILHETIRETAWLAFMRGSFSTAVFEAMRAVEIAVREASRFPDSDHGVPMIRRAFDKNHGPLTEEKAQDAEKEALSALFAGAIGSYKNPHSHRDVPINDPSEAIEIIILASHLLRIVDSRTPQSIRLHRQLS